MFGCNSTWLAYLLFGVGAPFFILQGDDMDAKDIITAYNVAILMLKREV